MNVQQRELQKFNVGRDGGDCPLFDHLYKFCELSAGTTRHLPRQCPERGDRPSDRTRLPSAQTRGVAPRETSRQRMVPILCSIVSGGAMVIEGIPRGRGSSRAASPLSCAVWRSSTSSILVDFGQARIRCMQWARCRSLTSLYVPT